MARSKVARRATPAPLWAPPYPQAIERSYNAALNAIIDEYGALLRTQGLAAYKEALAQRDMELRRDAWPDIIETAIGWLQFRAPLEPGMRAMRRTAQALKNFQGAAYRLFAREVMGVNAIQSEPKLEPLMEAWSMTNAKLITSIPEQYLRNVAQQAMEYVRMGRPSSEFAAELRKQYGLTKARAKLIARTETAKLNSAITRERQEALGLDVYVWRTAKDERVRASHKALEGMYCKYSDPTVCSRDGKVWIKRASVGGYEGDPGTDYQCRCTAQADVRSKIDQLLAA